MDRSAIYDALDIWLKDLADSYTIRVYTDKTVNVSLYKDDRQLSLEGDYYLIKYCLKSLYKEYL